GGGRVVLQGPRGVGRGGPRGAGGRALRVPHVAEAARRGAGPAVPVRAVGLVGARRPTGPHGRVPGPRGRAGGGAAHGAGGAGGARPAGRGHAPRAPAGAGARGDGGPAGGGGRDPGVHRRPRRPARGRPRGGGDLGRRGHVRGAAGRGGGAVRTPAAAALVS